MKQFINVYSSIEPTPVEITATKVFVASDIHAVTRTNDRDEQVNCYTYTVTEYDKDEYLALLSQNQQDIAALQEELRAAKILLGVE